MVSELLYKNNIKVQCICTIIIFYIVPTGAPQNVSASPINSTAIIITWQLPLFEDRNGNITGYSIIVTDTISNTSTTHYRNEIFAVIVSLHPYYEYVVQIAAETGVGRGPYGGAVTTQTMEDGKQRIKNETI